MSKPIIANAEQSSLGKTVAYVSQYDAGLLYPIPRAAQRRTLGIEAALPFVGVDIWNAYELSWLDNRGKPRVAIMEMRFPADSSNIIESKSLKLYLNSFMQTRFIDADSVRECIQKDLSQAADAAVGVTLLTLHAAAHQANAPLDGVLIDDLPVDIDHYGPPNPATLFSDGDETVHETLLSHLLKSNCPVTGQPDWASVQIQYQGLKIDRVGLLKYLISFREHNDFHEHCVEKIFCDIQQKLSPSRLSVYARYTRRGGLDINPYRGSIGMQKPGNPKTARQ